MEREKTKVRVAVNGLDENPGKTEEIAIVAQLVEKFHGKQWYVSSLFSTSFLAWFEKRVADDWSCDIMGEIERLNEENVRLTSKASQVQQDMGNVITIHDRKLSEARDGYESVIKGLKAENDYLKDTRAEYADGLEKERQRRKEVELELRNEQQSRANLLQDVLVLKAKLYDAII